MKRNLKMMLSLLLVFTMVLSFAIPTVAAEPKVIEVLSINDFHGSLKEGSKELGYAKLVEYISGVKEANANTLVVSAGDNYNGTALSNLTLGEPVNEMFKMLGMVASAVGNHEFDWGPDNFVKWAEDGGFTFLASNIYDEATDTPVEWASPYLITEVDGVKIAMIGIATPETLFKSLASSVEGLDFKDPVASAQEWVDYLEAGKAAEGKPDIILALTHLGASQGGYGSDLTEEVTGEAADLAAGTTGLDAILTGHSHSSVAGYVNDVAIVQGYKNGRSLSHLTITVEDDMSFTVVPEVLNLYKEKDDIEENTVAKENYDKWMLELSPILDVVLGQATGEVSHDRYGAIVTPLGRWTCEVMAEEAGAQIAFQNGGGLRTPIPEGDVTVGLLYEVMPYDNTLYTMDLLGADVLYNIEHGIGNEDVGNGSFSGLKVVYDLDLEFGSRVLSIELEDGTPLDLEASYKVVVNNFQATGGDNYDFSNGKNVVDTYIPIRDVLNAAVKADGIDPKEADYAVDVDMYEIKDGDVLWKIAKEYGMTYQELGDLNNLTNVNLIYAGEELYVPAQ